MERRKKGYKMKLLNCFRMKVVLVFFLAVIILGGGMAKADFTWTQKADMPTPRWCHASSVVNGKIYVIGGRPSEPTSGVKVSVVEMYDPATDTWTSKADMPTPRSDLSTSVVSGKIYAIGGSRDSGSVVEEYDPATDTWTRKADMPTERRALATCAVNGKIYAFGGLTSTAIEGSTIVEEYDPATDIWSRKADMSMRLWGLCANVVNGKIYVLGGRPGYTAIPKVQEYDPATDTWRQKAAMPVGTSSMGSVVLGDKIVVIGGWFSSGNYPYTTVQIYDPETNIWTIESDAPFLRSCCGASVVNNRIYLIGGTDRPHPCPATSTVYEFGPTPPDFNGDGFIDTDDLLILMDNWNTDEPLCDIGPMPWGDGVVDMQDLTVFIEYWEKENFPDFPNIHIDEDDDGSQVTLEQGQVLVVTLESNPTTGYRWDVVEDPNSILEQEGDVEFKPVDQTEPPMAGAGGWDILRFKAVSAGQETLELIYRRPWETDAEPAKTFSIEVTVN